MADIQSPRLLYLKGALFVGLGLLASGLILAEQPSFKIALLLGIAIWAFARAYYFAFYVVEHYVDPQYKFAGLIDFFRYVAARRAASPENGETPKSSLNDDRLIHLDAEELAEAGIKQAYESLLPKLRRYVSQPIEVEEKRDDVSGYYSVTAGDHEFVINSPDLKETEGRSWERAIAAMFTIVNVQLMDSEYRFYAINGGNDLGGMFLTPAEAEEAKRSLPRKADWPYMPRDEHPWYGQEH